MSKADYMENKVLDLLGGTTFTSPATVYVALYTGGVPTDASTGTTPVGASEVTGGSYARVSVTNNGTNWPAASGGAKANGAAITFPTPTANWGTVTAFAIVDAATLGNIWYIGAITPNKTVNNGDPAPSFAVGDLDITED